MSLLLLFRNSYVTPPNVISIGPQPGKKEGKEDEERGIGEETPEVIAKLAVEEFQKEIEDAARREERAKKIKKHMEVFKIYLMLEEEEDEDD